MFGIDYSDDEDDEEYIIDGSEFSTGFEKRKSKPYHPIDQVQPLNIESKLENAALNGDLPTVKDIFQNESKLKPNSKLCGRWTALMNAACMSQEHVVKYLLEIGADPNFKCEGNMTSLMCVCASNSQQTIATIECVKNLLDKKAIVNIGDRYGVTPLMKAVQTNKIDVVNMLLKEGANINMLDRMGKTAIFYGVENDMIDIVKLLIDKGASLDCIDRKGNTLKHMAKVRCCEPIIELLNQLDVENETEDMTLYHYIGEVDWRNMLPNVSTICDKPAYQHEIPMLLSGMKCERIIPIIMKNNIDLETFLTSNVQSLINLGVTLPYEQSKVLLGLYDFHTHNWSLETVAGLSSKNSQNFNPLESLGTMASHLQQITILKSSILYSIHRTIMEASELMTSDECLKYDEELSKKITSILVALRHLKKTVEKVNKRNTPSTDLIQPNHPVSAKSFKKTKIVICALTSVFFATVLSFKYKHVILDIQLPYIKSISSNFAFKTL